MKSKRLQWVLEGLQSRNFDFETAMEYGEPGYSLDKEIILLANWNALSKSELNAVESVAEIEWSDEWLVDDDGRAFRCSPDCYDWEPSFFLHDGEVIPLDSLSSDESLEDELRDYGYLFERGDGNFKAIPSSIEESTLELFATLATPDCMQTGFHPGQNDSPEKLIQELPPGEYCFRISSKSQFTIEWQAWLINSKEEDE